MIIRDVHRVRGYNTDAERQEAAAIPGITTIPRHAFLELLKWGIAMGVSAVLNIRSCQSMPSMPVPVGITLVVMVSISAFRWWCSCDSLYTSRGQLGSQHLNTDSVV